MHPRFVRALLLAALPWTLVFPAAALATPVELTILHTNDTHDHLEPFDTKNGKERGGVARRTTLFKAIKAKTPNVVILDAGDVFQGTPLFTFFSGEPDYVTMRQAGYDAITVGNHDLDNGLANLQKQAQQLASPPLSITLVGSDGQLLFPGYKIIKRGGLKIAVIGIMGRNAYEAIAKERRVGVSVLDPATVLKKVVPLLRATSDLVVVLSHTGHDEEVALAGQVPGIDLIVGGHSHSKVEKPVAVKNGDRTTLVVQAFQWGEFVGHLDLTVDDHHITRYDGKLVPVTSDLVPDPEVAATVDRYARQIAVQMNQVMGQSAVEFLNSRKAEGDAPIGNLVADALRDQTGADIGLMNSGGIRSPLPKGDVTRGMVFSMLPFENRLVTFQADATLVQGILDFAAVRAGHSGSMQISGVSFAVVDGRAIDVLIAGKPLDPRRTYTISTIDYIADGNDGAEVFKRATQVKATGILVRDAFFAYMKKNPVLKEPQSGRIKRVQPTAH